MPLPELPECLVKFGATLRASAPDEMTEEGGALPYAVWDSVEDGILGSGYTPEEAIAEAVKTVEGWSVPAQDFE